jgi:transposase
MERWIKRVIEKERKKYGYLEAKKIGSHYYLYRASSVYDPEKKRARKVSGEYMGKVTPRGLERKRGGSSVRSIFEYANARLLYDISVAAVIPQLKRAFPYEWKELLAMALVRVIRPVPMKCLGSAWEKLYLSTEVDCSLSPNTLSDRLRSVGSDWSSQRDFFSSLLKRGDTLLFDLSSIFSHSVNVRLAEKGYNKEHLHLNQINFAMVFSATEEVPVMLKPIPGSVRDVKAFHHALREFEMRGCTLVLDRGLFSKDNVGYMTSNGLSFVQPMKRDAKVIDYALEAKASFAYRGRGIKWVRKELEGDGGAFLYIFEDVKLRGEEESNLIELVSKGKIKGYDGSRLGKISVLSNINDRGSRVYGLLKQREDIEQGFDAMKNELENDKAYLQSDEAVRGYFFVSFISLYLYYRVLAILKRKGLSEKFSVNEVLMELSKVYLVRYSDSSQKLSEIPKKVEDLVSRMALEDILPKNLRS